MVSPFGRQGTEAQRAQDTCPQSHSSSVREPRVVLLQSACCPNTCPNAKATCPGPWLCPHHQGATPTSRPADGSTNGFGGIHIACAGPLRSLSPRLKLYQHLPPPGKIPVHLEFAKPGQMAEESYLNACGAYTILTTCISKSLLQIRCEHQPLVKQTLVAMVTGPSASSRLEQSQQHLPGLISKTQPSVSHSPPLAAGCRLGGGPRGGEVGRGGAVRLSLPGQQRSSFSGANCPVSTSVLVGFRRAFPKPSVFCWGVRHRKGGVLLPPRPSFCLFLFLFLRFYFLK